MMKVILKLRAWNFMLAGVVIMIIGGAIEATMHDEKQYTAPVHTEKPSAAQSEPEHPAVVQSSSSDRTGIGGIIAKVASGLVVELGIAFFVLGGVGVLFETTEMKNYFHERFEESLKAEEWKDDLVSQVHQNLEDHEWKRSVLRKTLYAELLEKNSYKPVGSGLTAMNAIKALSALEQTDVANSEIERLIDHQKGIIGAIANGYKANMEIKIEYFLDGPDTFRVEDTTNYSTRRGRNDQTPEMIYAAGKGELVSVESVDFERFADGEWQSLFSDGKADQVAISESRRTCFVQPLRKNISELAHGTEVRIVVVYTVRRDSLLTWKSQLPVFNYTLHIAPPDGYMTKVSKFMPHDPRGRDVPRQSRPNMSSGQTEALDDKADVWPDDVHIVFPEWNMPYQGVVWSFVKKSDEGASRMADQNLERI